MPTQEPIIIKTRSTLSGQQASAPTLQVGITVVGAWMLGVGSIIGSMAWLIHGPMLAKAGSLPTIVAWMVAGVMTLPLGLILAELSSMFPTAGGPYVYKYEAFKLMFPRMGELCGFLAGWLYWSCFVIGLGLMANGFASLLSSALWTNSEAPIWFAPASILLLFAVTTWLNLLHVKSASWFNTVLTITKLLMAGVFVMLVLKSPSCSFHNILEPGQNSSFSEFFSRVASVLALAMAGYSGIEGAACTSSETVDAARKVPIAIMLTLFTVAVIYISTSVAISVAAPYQLSADGTTMVVVGTNIQATCPAIAGFLGGAFWGQVFTAGVIMSIAACGFSALLALSRISYSMAQTGLFPAKFLQLDARNKVPTQALWFQFWCISAVGIGASLLPKLGILADPYAFLGDVLGFTYGLLAVLYAVSFISLRYTLPDMERPFRVGGAGNIVAWGLGLAVILIFGSIALYCTSWMHKAASIVILLAGIPIYCFGRR